jgi:hypothetical protein
MTGSNPGERQGRMFRWRWTDEGYIAEWPGILAILATSDGGIREVVISPDAPSEAVEKVRRGAAVAFARAIAGKSSLHASAVSFDGAALLCVGPSGAGKSSLAKVLCERAGARLLADDVTLVDEVAGRWHASPSETAVWLRTSADASERPKVPIPCPTAGSSAPIAWIVQMSFDDELKVPYVCPLKGAAAPAVLLSALVRFDPSPALMLREMTLAAALLTQAAILHAVRPRRGSVEATADAILNAVRDLSTAASGRSS